MNEIEYKNFIKRYDKFKKNNLPTPFWDEERQTLEYVYYDKLSPLFYIGEIKDENVLEISSILSQSLADIAFTGFYFPFTDKQIEMRKDENGKIKQKIVIGHNHAHSFEEVVKALYNSPESFNIAKDEEQFYSKQELDYLRQVQKYLLFIGMKDLERQKAPISRYRNKIRAKYENALIYRFSSETINNILTGKVDFRITKWYPEHSSNRIYKPKEYQALIVDEEDNFKMFVEFTYEETKLYKEIKDIYKREDLEDNDQLIITHFKILETFNNN